MELYTIDDIAQMLGVNPRTVRRYIEKGQLRGERIGGVWRVTGDSLKAMFDDPELKDKIAGQIQSRSEDMLNLYMNGKHRLQQGSSPIMTVFVFDPQRDTWVFNKSAEWMGELNRLGKNAQFDFTMTGSEKDPYQLVLIASFPVAQAMLGELERVRIV